MRGKHRERGRGYRRLQLWLVMAALGSISVACDAIARDNAGDREKMVKNIEINGVRDKATLDALRTVPRDQFVPGAWRSLAYSPVRPLPIGYGQTISAPDVVALMTEQLHLQATNRVLEVGTGSGYQAAILAEIVNQVFTIEIIRPLAESAASRLHALGYTNVETRVGDGYYGWPEKQPFDAIIVTAAASHIPPPLIEQLRPGGRMVIPVGPVMQTQHLLVVEKAADGTVRQRSILPVMFVPLTGGPELGR